MNQTLELPVVVEPVRHGRAAQDTERAVDARRGEVAAALQRRRERQQQEAHQREGALYRFD